MAPAAAPRRLATPGWLIIAIVAMVALVGGLGLAVRYGPLTSVGRAFLAAEVSGLKVGRFGRLRIEGVRGDLWRRFSVERLTIADAKGVWLDARDVGVQWRSGELWRRRFHADLITARTITVLRRPSLTPPEANHPQSVSVDVDKARARIITTPAFSYRDGAYDLGAAFHVERSGGARGAVVAFSALHAGDRFRARFDIGRKVFLLDADAREAAGGAMAGSLGLAADQPFMLNAHAKGSVRAGAFAVLARVGAATPLIANGAWNGAGGSAQGRLELAASSLLAPYRDALGPQIAFTIGGRKAADGFYALALLANSQNASLSAHGEADVGRQATGPSGVAFDAQIADASRITAWPKLGAARLSGGIGGDARRWVVAGAARLDHPMLGAFGLARVTGPVHIDGKGGTVDLKVTADGDGGAGAGLAAALLGARPRGAAEVTWLPGGRVLMRRIDITGSGLKVSAAGESGLFGDLSFKGQASVTNLAAARPGASGVILANWSAHQDGAAKPWSFSFDAQARRFASGLGQLDRLLGAAPRLRAKASFDKGVVAISGSSLDGAAGTLSTAGEIGPRDTLKLKLDWRAQGPFTLGPLEIAGAAKGSGALTGTLASPKADLLADFARIDIPYAPLGNAHVVLSFLGDAGRTDGRFSVTAASAYGPAAAEAAFAFAPTGVDVSHIAVNAAGVTAEGSLALRQNQPSTADLRLTAGPGALLSQGRAAGRLRLVDAPGGGRVQLTLDASNAVLRQSGLAVGALKLSADGPLARLPYVASMRGVAQSGPWRVAGSGVLIGGGAGDHRLTFAGDGRAGAADVRTVSPAEIRFGAAGVFAQLRLASGDGRADIDLSQVRGAVTAKATLAKLSLSLVNADLVGRLDGTLDLNGAGANLRGDFDARLSGVAGRDFAGSPPVNGLVKASLLGNALTVSANLANSSGLKAAAEFTLPAEASAAPFNFAINKNRPMRGRFAVDGELKPVWDLVMGGERTLAGHLLATGTVGGTLADPRAVGTASLDRGSFEDDATGLKLQSVSLHANLTDNAIDVRQFSAGDGAKGAVTGAGAISLERQGLSSFRLDLKDFRLIDNDIAKAAASGQVTVSRAADGKVKLSGALTVDRAQIAANPPTPSGVVPMDVVEINTPPDLEARQPRIPHAAPVALDVALTAPGGIFVRGRGLNVEMSLDARVTGTTADPALSGVARVVRGDYDFAGKRFQIDEHGVVYLSAAADAIRLDLTAVRDDPNLTAVIRIQGTAAKPRITLTSRPVLPSDEILSQLLFGTVAGQLPALQAAQLASDLSTLAGGGGFDVIGGLRNFARLDRLALGGNAATGATISGGKYLSDNLYVALTGGRTGPTVQIEWRVRKHLSIVSSVARQGDSQISVRWRKNY